MRKIAIWIGIALAVLLAPIAVLYVTGLFISREHHASVSETIAAPPDRVLDAITDVESFPQWRSGVSAVNVTSRDPLRWREQGENDLAFEMIERSPARVITRVSDDGGNFGGTWTFELAPDGEGTRVTITEDGWIGPPIFRTLSKFAFGYERSMRAYLAALRQHQGRLVRIERVL
jgi:carbon monoxide dehydrogenase subunit G